MKYTICFLTGCLLSGSAFGQTPRLMADNISEIIAAMTVGEKVSLLSGTGRTDPDEGQTVVGATTDIVPGAAGTTRAIERLGIPAIVVADGPAGVRIDAHRKDSPKSYYCTRFPVATALAATWNTSLTEEVGGVMGEEARSYGIDLLLAPATNIMRNPLCGRNFEYYSEDPVLAGKMAAAAIRGIQSCGVGTSLKHFALNNQETARAKNNACVAPAVMHNLYLRPFEIAVREARPWSVMTAYNRVNGTPASENPLLLDTVLRQKWGFRGMVMTDWYGGQNPVAQMTAGNDLLMPGSDRQRETLLAAIRSGELSMKTVDRNVRNILELVVKTNRFKGECGDDSPDLEAHAAVSRRAAAEAIVLLKNDGVLPFSGSVRRIAAFGNTSYDLIAGGTGSGEVNCAYTVSLTEGLTNAGYAVDSLLTGKYASYLAAQKQLLPAPQWSQPQPQVIEMPLSDDEIERASATTDLAVITIGRSSGEFFDRGLDNDFYLSEAEQSLISRVCTRFHAAGKQVIVLLNVCGVVETASWRDAPDAILVSWLGGQEGGNAIADVLSGAVTPSGRLPMTFPMDYADVPSSENFPLPDNTASRDETRYEEGMMVGYRYFDKHPEQVAYPFGYGLSYTEFSCEDISVEPAADSLCVSCRITNTGRMPGKEVVQLYIAPTARAADQPDKELKAFAKTRTLAPGEGETLHFTFPFRYLARYDDTGIPIPISSEGYSIYVKGTAETYKTVVKFD